MVAFDPVIVFDGDAETVKDLSPGGVKLFQVSVGECKVIGFRFFRIGVEIGENVRDVHVMRPAVGPGGVMQTAERDPGFLESFRRFVEADRTVVDSVERFDFAFQTAVEIGGNGGFSHNEIHPC